MTSQEKLLWAAFERIKADPTHYDQRLWMCGTIGCLAYHIVAAAHDGHGCFPRVDHISMAASRLLGFDCRNIYEKTLANYLFACPVSYDTAPDKVKWLENHIRQWVEKYCKGNQVLGKD